MLNLNYKHQTLLLLAAVSLLAGCDDKQPIKEFLEHKIPLASGMNFDTKKFVILKSETGEAAPTCNPTADYDIANKSAKSKPSSDPKCSAQFIVPESNTALRDAIALSKQTIEGEIMKDGKAIPAQYFVTVTAHHKGSHCNVIGYNGSGGEICGR